jgi:class 3 adenylate cyclase
MLCATELTRSDLKQPLVSESLLERLPDKDHALVSFVAEEELRGKETTTKIYAIVNPLQRNNWPNNMSKTKIESKG